MILQSRSFGELPSDYDGIFHNDSNLQVAF
jgi:hypothetical protein